MTRWLLPFVFLACAGCIGGEPSFVVGSQTWNGIDVVLEARQSPVDPAMFEFLVVGTNAQRRPANDLTVSIRLQDQEPWKQAMQDGLVGVYRRAYKIGDPRIGELQVQLRRGDDEAGVLRFALVPLAGPPNKL